MKDLQTITKRRVKKFFAAHHYIFHTTDTHEIAAIVNVKVETVKKWLRQDNWQEYLQFWGRIPKTNIGDLASVEKLWEQMIQDDTHVFSPELQELYIDEKHRETLNAEPAANYSLQPYIIEGLSEYQIRQRIAEFQHEGYKPKRYTGEHASTPRWWLFPNFDAGIFSQVFARANVANHIVCGSDEDTHLVCISDRLTISQNFADTVAIASDERLLVCL